MVITWMYIAKLFGHFMLLYEDSHKVFWKKPNAIHSKYFEVGNFHGQRGKWLFIGKPLWQHACILILSIDRAIDYRAALHNSQENICGWANNCKNWNFPPLKVLPCTAATFECFQNGQFCSGNWLIFLTLHEWHVHTSSVGVLHEPWTIATCRTTIHAAYV